MNELKQIPMKGSFQANGKTYYIEEKLSIDRWLMMNDLQIQLGFGAEYQEMQQKWFDVIDLGNKLKFSDIVIIAHNMVNGISKVYDRHPMILKFCALYMNTEDEDRGIITDDMINAKIDDWRLEGLGMDGFFIFSLSIANGLAENLQKVTPNVLDLIQGKEIPEEQSQE